MAGQGRPVLAMLGRSDRRLSEALCRNVAGEAPPDPGGLLGLELEFSVRTVGGGRVHFGSLIHRLGLDGTALDPGDPNAYRCSWGGVITADGAEAEIATPPVGTRPGFTARLQDWARAGEAELRRAVPPGIGLDGYSAHFSAAMPANLNDRVCRLYAETFAADLMLLMDRIDSPGLLVRPRPGRTELCGEFIADEPLAAAAAFVAGTTRACAAAVRRPGRRTALPPRLDVRLARAVHRYGWYVDRRAFGTDLHAASRRALLPRASGGTICAQSHLELAWAAARQALAEDAAASDLHAAEAMVAGSLPLPAERGQPDDTPGGRRGGTARFPLDSTAVPATPRPYGHVRPGFTLRPVAVTWDFTVFEARGPARSAYACIPRDSLPGFLAALEDGALDDAIAAYLALTSRRRVLSAPEQTRRPGLYDQMNDPAELLAPERDPQTGHRESGDLGAKRTLARPGKRNRQDQEAPRKEQEAPRKASRSFRRAAAIGAAAVVVLAGAAAAITLLGHGHSGPSVKPPALVSFQPTALVFPEVQVDTSITRSFTMTNSGSSPATITGISIGGPSRHDFSVPGSDLLAAYRGGDAIHTAAQTPACHRSIPPAQTCMITVVFTPTAPGSRTADLRIYLPSPQRPRDIALSGTSTIAPPRSSRSVSVTRVSPARGTVAGGTRVTITGSGFTASPADTGVSFGGAAAPKFIIDSGTQITATSPPGTGTVHVTVTTPAGTSAATAADQFTYTHTTTITTTTALTSSANPSVYGQAVNFTATVSPASGTGTPTGTVTFVADGTQIGTASLDSSGTATVTTSALAAGRHTVTATYAASNSFKGSSDSLTQTVSKAAATIVVNHYTVTYDGNAHTATGTATGVNGETLSGLNLSGTTHIKVGTYSDTWTFTDTTGNYNNASGTVTDTIVG
jgi:Bacterial Ig-like domain (group 3)/IPT/TIG domain